MKLFKKLVYLYNKKNIMGRLEKMKRLIIEQANKRILGEEYEDTEGCHCSDGSYNIMCCPDGVDFKNIVLNHNDSTQLEQKFKDIGLDTKSHTFMDSLNDNVHAHLGPDNHLLVQLTHLGPHHNIELDLEGSYPTSHGGHDEHEESHSDFGSMKPHIVFGGGVKIPIKSFGGHHKH